jgi:hypothetical protein
MRVILTRSWRFVCGLAAPTALLLVSFAVCMLALEIGVRVWDGVPILSVQNFVARPLDQVHGHGIVDYDPRVGWVQTPNAERPDIKMTTGEYGIRMSSAKIQPVPRGAILVVGDSFGAGAEVTDADSWPTQLEQMLGMNVVNAGVGGYGLDQVILRAETLLPLLKPRMLLLQTRLEYGISVDRMSVSSGAPKPYFTVQNDELVLHNDPVPRVAPSRANIGWARSVFGYSYLVQYAMTRLNLLQWWGNPESIKFELSPDEAVQVGCLLMHRIADIRDRSGIPVALVVQYSGVEAMEQPLHWQRDRNQLLACAQDRSLEVVDTLEALRTSYRNSDLASYQRLWMMHDHDRVYGHMSPEGNHLIASLIAKQLSRDFDSLSETDQGRKLSQKSK